MPSADGYPVLNVLARWRWMALYMLGAVLVSEMMASHRPLEDPRQLAGAAGWVLAHGMSWEETGEGVVFRAAGEDAAIATRRYAPLPGATAVEVEVCRTAPAVATGGAALMLASLRREGPDFNRQYVADYWQDPAPGSCVSDQLPRFAGDGDALLQLQITASDTALGLSSLTLRSVAETRSWFWMRVLALPLGLLLLAQAFFQLYRQLPRSGVYGRMSAAAGMLVVAGIVFGCCVSVGLKAQIYALLTGGRELAVAAPESLLLTPFPLGGFGLFSAGHTLLFAAAGLALLPLKRTALLDLALLALATETLQRFVPGRGPGLGDVLIDWFGLALAVLLLLFLRRARRVDFLAQK